MFILHIQSNKISMLVYPFTSNESEYKLMLTLIVSHSLSYRLDHEDISVWRGEAWDIVDS